MHILDYPSLNYDARPKGISVWLVIIHYTGMANAQQALTRLCSPEAKVSAHYTIDEDGQVYRHVREAFRAWHAGRSGWQGVRDINGCSIGIELVNPGHGLEYREFPDVQMISLETLLWSLLERYQIKQEGILGHSDVACARKKDPGELFDWHRLARRGLGLWPSPREADSGFATEKEVHNLLMAYGYDIDLAGDLSTVVKAFQRHFYPEHITGLADQETINRLRSLVRQSSRSIKANTEKKEK